MNCHKVQSLTSAYVDCELSGLEMLAIRQHLSECDECRTEFESLLSVKKALGGLRAKHPSADLASRICAQLDHIQPPVPAHKRILTAIHNHLPVVHTRMRWAAACMGVFALLMVFRGGDIGSNGRVLVGASQPPPYANAGAMAEMTAISLDPGNGTVSLITPPPARTTEFTLANYAESRDPISTVSLSLINLSE